MSRRATADEPLAPGPAAAPAPPRGSRPALVRAAFDAVNRADWAAALAMMCEDVVWDDGLSGGRRQGRASLGRHWAWLAARFAPRVEILGLEPGPQGALRVEAHLLIHDVAGKQLAHQDVRYVLRFRGERIAVLERGEEGRGGG